MYHKSKKNFGEGRTDRRGNSLLRRANPLLTPYTPRLDPLAYGAPTALDLAPSRLLILDRPLAGQSINQSINIRLLRACQNAGLTAG